VDKSKLQPFLRADDVLGAYDVSVPQLLAKVFAVPATEFRRAAVNEGTRKPRRSAQVLEGGREAAAME